MRWKKTVEKTFDVEALPNLVMDGIYSDFNITTWDQPQIDFKVKITVKSDRENTVKSLDKHYRCGIEPEL